jgi:hypothetical protein
LALHLDLEPKPSWNRWDHTEDGIWPVAEDSERPLNDVVGPEWLDRAGSVARECLETGSGPLVVGHGDWYRENLRFAGEDLFIAHDWDSVIVDREAIIVGFAAADYIAPSIEESAQFLRVYQEVSNRQFTADEIREAARPYFNRRRAPSGVCPGMIHPHPATGADPDVVRPGPSVTFTYRSTSQGSAGGRSGRRPTR